MLEKIKGFWQDEEGMGTLEILLIVVVLVGIALMFRKKITQWVDVILNNVDEEVNLNSTPPTKGEGE